MNTIAGMQLFPLLHRVRDKSQFIDNELALSDFQPTGEYADPKLRDYASTVLGVTTDEFEKILAGMQIQPLPVSVSRRDQTSDAAIPDASTRQIDVARDAVIRLGMSILGQVYQNARLRVMNIDQELDGVLLGYFDDIAYGEFVTYVGEMFVFESNIAFKHSFCAGETIEERLLSLKQLYADGEYIEYLEDKYPVLLQRLGSRLMLISEAVAELGNRVLLDLPIIREKFNISTATKVSRVYGSSGDSHNKGRRVAIIEFDSGVKLVYKPRSIGVEAAFQDLLLWVNEKSTNWSFRNLGIICCENYGWVEFADAYAAKSDIDASKFYYRYGALTAILYAVSGTDIHFENLVSCGDQPVVVDLETILQSSELIVESSDERKHLMGLDHFFDSPLYTAMLDPAQLTGSLNGSPLTAKGAKGAVDEMVLTLNENLELVLEETPPIEVDLHLFKGPSGIVSFENYTEDLTKGFDEALTLIARHRAELATDVIPRLFGGTETRHIFRYTQTYGKYLKAIASPYALQSIANYEEVVSKLWSVAHVSKSSGRVIPFEMMDLWNGDVPYFKTAPERVEVISSAGDEVTGVFTKSGLDTVRDRIISLNSSSIDSLTKVVGYSLRTKKRDLAEANSAASSEQGSDLPTDPSELLRLIASRIDFDDERATLVGPVMNNDLQTRIEPLAYRFYDGLPGVCFALAYEGYVGRSSKTSDAARALARSIMQEYEPRSDKFIGICQGVAGTIYLMSHLTHLWQDESYALYAHTLVNVLGGVAWNDRYYDVYSGTAGAFLAVDSLLSVSGSTTSTNIALMLADQLVESAQIEGSHASWVSSIPSEAPTTGFAHGIAGIGYALLRAYRRFSDPRYLDVAIKAEAFLRRCVDANTGRWKECPTDSAPSHMDVWCHGAPGIALFYRELSKWTKSQDHERETVRANTLTISGAKFDNDSLCHGSLGNIDVFISAALESNVNPCTSPVGGEVMTDMAAEVASRPPLCGTERRHWTVALFNGLSGIAYQRIRMQSAVWLPSVLTFDAPIRHEN